MSSAVLHAILFALALTAYVVLTVTGHDGNPVFLFFAGQVSGAVIQSTKNGNGNSTVNEPLQVAPKRSTIQ